MKDVISGMLFKAFKEIEVEIKKEDIEKLIEIPPSQEMGDYAFPCFSLAAKMKMPPEEIALDIRGKIKDSQGKFEDIQTKGPYINFFLNRKIMALNLIKEVKSLGDRYGKSKKINMKTMVEFPSPNTNKPLHLGHLRNMTIGEGVSRILEFNGEKVIRANLNNDRGIHICKSMAAYKFYGRKRKPNLKKQKSDHFVGDFYVMFNKKQKEILKQFDESSPAGSSPDTESFFSKIKDMLG
jgi:arginyl-tRNA synthetase